MGRIKIHKPGLLSTIQDMGRIAYQKFGMPVSGAMDTYALQLANLMVGNAPDEACIEATLMAPQIECLDNTELAVAGASVDVFINDQLVDSKQNHQLKKGDMLNFGALQQGCRLYIAFAGGIDVPLVMGSKSTYLRGKLGGFLGRALLQGDEIDLGMARNFQQRKTKLDYPFLPRNMNVVRIIAAAESPVFSFSGIETFLTETYTVSTQSDRMGYRLNGPCIQHKSGADILSAGIANGTIQVPTHGEPIIMLADRQTVGGYTKIANVISVDLPLLGQLKAGDKIRFMEVQLDAAHQLICEQKKNLENAVQRIEQ